MLKRIGIIFLTLLLCLGGMTSCFIVVDERTGDGTSSSPETEAQTQAPPVKVPFATDVLSEGRADAEKALEGLFEGKDYQGLTFSVIIAEDADLDITAEQETSYERALKIQTDLLEKKLGCQIYVTRTPYNTFLSDSQAAMNSGMFYADLVLIPQKGLGYLKSQNMLADLSGLYGDVFGYDCYNEDAKAQASGGGKLYAVAANGTVTPGAYGCVYMNKAVTDAYGITKAVYEAVDNGSWTIDKMLEFKAGCAENHGDIAAVGATGADVLIEGLFASAGMRYFTKAESGYPAVCDNGGRFDALVAKLRALVADTAACTFSEDVYELFKQEKVLFYIDTLDKASSVKGDYTVLPLPKLDGEQEGYYTYSDGNAYMFAVLATNNRPEYAAELMRGFCETGDMLREAFARDLLDYAFANQESYKYVNEIFNGARYEFAYMFGEAYPSVADSSYNALKQAVLANADFDNYVGGQVWRYNADLNTIFG